MDKKHNFVRLAEAQRLQETSYNVGLDVHGFGGYEQSLEVYGALNPKPGSSEHDLYLESYRKYRTVLELCFINDRIILNKFAQLLAAIDNYLKRLIDIYIEKARIYTFKPQAAFYEQFGPAGMLLLASARNYIKASSETNNVPAICILDCKRGDIFTTQGAYFNAYLGSLKDDWGISYTPYDFEIINVSPWMGRDVLVLYDKGKWSKGLKLMKQGKGLIGVNKTTNPSGPEYQELPICDGNVTLQMKHVADMKEISRKEGLEYQGLSTIGLVVGSTHECSGAIRTLFPETTLLVPGFGAQGGKFEMIMLELIRSGEWNGQGAIFSSSRGSMFPFMTKYGGSGDVKNLESDLLKAVEFFRKAEKRAYEAADVRKAGIEYPYKKAA